MCQEYNNTKSMKCQHLSEAKRKTSDHENNSVSHGVGASEAHR